MLLKSSWCLNRWFEKIRPCLAMLAMLAMPCHAANCRTILRHRVLLLFILVTATAFTTFPTLSDKTRNIQYMCHFVLFYILCWWLNDKYMGVYLIYGSPNFWKPHCVCIQVPLQHWCYLFRGASEQLKSWKRGRRLKYFASEMKIFCSGDEKSLIGCNQPRWSSQYSEGQIFIIGYRKRILKVQKDWKVTITVFLSWVQKT